MLKLYCACTALLLAIACSEDTDNTYDPHYRYYEVGKRDTVKEWRDTAFVVAVAATDTSLLRAIQAELALPVAERKIVNGALAPGSGGYNKNGPHAFKWHFREDDWGLTDLSAEIFDGRPYTDVDLHYDYWMDTVKRLAPWDSYIKREITP